jgi:thymidylate synthase ThyX
VIRAEVIADSISPRGDRLTTLQVTFPRCILSEINTHRAFSRNSASSRAVPVRRMLEQVQANPFIPLRWQNAQAGMQGGEDLNESRSHNATQEWLCAARDAVEHAKAFLDSHRIHKTMANRLLEPFAWHTAIISGTDWHGFWRQRCSPLAEIHMEATATAMAAAYDESEPQPLSYGDWHLPYVDPGEDFLPLDVRLKLSAARCARVSYLTHDGQRDQDADVALYEKLVTAEPAHWSPLEHQATPAPGGMIPRGNFTGFEQHRHRLEGDASHGQA